jgi:hypothetical protein
MVDHLNYGQLDLEVLYGKSRSQVDFVEDEFVEKKSLFFIQTSKVSRLLKSKTEQKHAIVVK